jgi:aryl-alcohol dehydrogenase-like predicted oxidoreductase
MTADRPLPHRTLGAHGPEVSAIGLGCMGMTGLADVPFGTYGPSDPSEAIATIHRAIDLGVTLLDTAEMYGPYTNEKLVGRAIRRRRERVVVSTKFGVIREPDGGRRFDGHPDRVRRSCEGSLRRLGVDVIDLYFLHRVDPVTPVEETVGAMSQLVDAGKVRHIGLSMAPPDLLHRAHAVHPVAALQSEYSLLCREPESDVLPTCRELGIGFMAYSPLGRGLLAGTIRSSEELDEHDLRRRAFGPRHVERSRLTVADVRRVAASTGSTPAQVALRWLLAQGGDIVPIPGSKHPAKVDENVGAFDVPVNSRDLAVLDSPPPAAS